MSITKRKMEVSLESKESPNTPIGVKEMVIGHSYSSPSQGEEKRLLRKIDLR